VARIKYKEAIGMPVRRGRPSTGRLPTKEDLTRLYIIEAKSIREIAEELSILKDTVHRALKKYKIGTRSNVSRSKLRKISLSDLEVGIREKGIRGFARELGVDEGTVRHHMKVRKC